MNSRKSRTVIAVAVWLLLPPAFLYAETALPLAERIGWILAVRLVLDLIVLPGLAFWFLFSRLLPLGRREQLSGLQRTSATLALCAVSLFVGWALLYLEFWGLIIFGQAIGLGPPTLM